MAEYTGISWCDHTFNPWIGCTKISPACDFCYAETWDNRFGGGHWGATAERRRTSRSNWRNMEVLDRRAAQQGVRRRVFCASLADVFDNHVDLAWRSDLWALIGSCRNLDWLLLTKRPQNIKKMLPVGWDAGWPNVWLGTTVENQVEADRRIPHLLSVPATIRFLSCEPLLGSLDIGWALSRNPIEIASGILSRGRFSLGMEKLRPIDWVICGGGSGAGARPMHPDWVRDLRDDCADAGVAFFFKQWGEWAPEAVSNSERAAETAERIDLQGNRRMARFGARRPGEITIQRVGKKAAGDLLNGKRHHEWPSVRIAT